jgi:hypothetical protein
MGSKGINSGAHFSVIKMSVTKMNSGNNVYHLENFKSSPKRAFQQQAWVSQWLSHQKTRKLDALAHSWGHGISLGAP